VSSASPGMTRTPSVRQSGLAPRAEVLMDQEYCDAPTYDLALPELAARTLRWSLEERPDTGAGAEHAVASWPCRPTPHRQRLASRHPASRPWSADRGRRVTGAREGVHGRGPVRTTTPRVAFERYVAQLAVGVPRMSLRTAHLQRGTRVGRAPASSVGAGQVAAVTNRAAGGRSSAPRKRPPARNRRCDSSFRLIPYCAVCPNSLCAGPTAQCAGLLPRR
jgi:hypothetical protein